jgi:hypothetical protein
MSHYAAMEVDFDVKYEQNLVAALEKVFGKGNVEVHENGAPLFGWHGDDRSQVGKKSQDYAPPCEVIVRRKHVGGAANDLGFRRTKEGKYESYISDHDKGANFSKEKQGLVAQEYGLRVTEQVLKSEGWSKFTRTTLSDGSVRIEAKEPTLKLRNWK